LKQEKIWQAALLKENRQNSVKARLFLLCGTIGPAAFKMEKKIKAGIEFFQTQAVYEVEKFA